MILVGVIVCTFGPQQCVHGFAVTTVMSRCCPSYHHHQPRAGCKLVSKITTTSQQQRKLSASPNNFEDETEFALAESDQLTIGIVGTITSLITLYSEYTLKQTGCGLPAGPFGIVGLLEGLSYLSVSGLVVYSIITKIRTSKGLPAGPYGLLGAAEGLSFLSILVGLVVLVLQVTNYGYIPNAIPMDGGMCS
jgi:hypothetical protein